MKACLLLLLAIKARAFFSPSHFKSLKRGDALSSVVEKTNQQSDKEQASLTFRCDTTFTSDPVPAATPAQVFKFLEQPAQRNCMVSAGNAYKTEDVVVTDELLEQWKQRCREMGALEPDKSDCVVRVETPGMQFPGVTVSSNAYIGGKLVWTPGDSSFPVYEFSLIRDEQSATGFEPAVWLFKKLTGTDERSKKNKKMPSSVTRVSSSMSADDNTIFRFDIEFAISVNFPKVLLRLLPVSKEKAEEQGSAAIKKTLTRDVSKAVHVLREQYMEQL